MDTTKNAAQQIAELESKLFYMRMERDVKLAEVASLNSRIAEAEDGIKMLKPSTIDLVGNEDGRFTNDRARIAAALAKVRKANHDIKGISLHSPVKYDDDTLYRTAFISYPMGEGIGDQLFSALKEQGLGVEWDGNEARAIQVHPTCIPVWYRERSVWDPETHHFSGSVLVAETDNDRTDYSPWGAQELKAAAAWLEGAVA